MRQLVARLVAIESVNPSLVADGAGETEVAAFVADWARAAGLEATTLERMPGRPSVLVRAAGRGGGRTLLLCAHLDTVGVGAAGLEPRVDGDRLYGRGSYDMKGALAAALLACRDAAAHQLAGDVVVAAVADEEHASLGVQEVLETVHADAAIVVEPTELVLAVAHKGFVWTRIDVTGKAAHGSRPHLGVDAILKAGPILTGLAQLDAELASRAQHPLVGRGSLHASLISGGEELSSYPAQCAITVERRTLPGETAAGVERDVDALLERCRAADPELAASATTLLVREPFELDPSHALVAAVRAAAADALGAPPPVAGVSYWADSALIAAAGIPTVLLGPIGAGAHADVEWVSLDSLDRLRGALAAVAARVCA